MSATKAKRPTSKAKATGKRGGRRSTSWRPGASSPNPKGRPPKGETWRDILRELGEMTGEEVASWLPLLASDLRRVGSVKLKHAAAAKVYLSLIADPGASLFRAVIERCDGLVPAPIAGTRALLREDGLSDEAIDRIMAESDRLLARAGAGDEQARNELLERIKPRPGELDDDNGEGGQA